MPTFESTETVRIIGTIRDEDDVLVTPGTSTKITILDPTGAKVVDAQNVAFDAVGTFRYAYTPSGSPIIGAYHARITAIDSAKLSITDTEFFVVD